MFPKGCVYRRHRFFKKHALTASLLTCRASALKKEHRRSFSLHQWCRLDKRLIKTSRSHPRLLSASLPQICWCQILWQLKGAAIDIIRKPRQSCVCLHRPNGVCHQNKLLFPARTCSLPLFFQTVMAATLISLSARKPAPLIYFIYLYFPPKKPRAVSLATARFINICSRCAQRHSALVNALLQHNRLCTFSHSISTSSKTLAEQLGCVSCVLEEGWQGVSLTFSQRPSPSKLIFLPLAATVGSNDDK